ncbi:MAG: hypothetical protein ACJASM_002941, partial [Salibacteraceae bacterium]
MLKVLYLITIFLSTSLTSLSQSGVYEMIGFRETPKEAKGNFVDSNGGFEYPIYVSAKGTVKTETPVIKLKRTK